MLSLFRTRPAASRNDLRRARLELPPNRWPVSLRHYRANCCSARCRLTWQPGATRLRQCRIDRLCRWRQCHHLWRRPEHQVGKHPGYTDQPQVSWLSTLVYRVLRLMALGRPSWLRRKAPSSLREVRANSTGPVRPSTYQPENCQSSSRMAHWLKLPLKLMEVSTQWSVVSCPPLPG